MKRYIVGLAALAVAWVALPAMADWLPGDDHKMHYPQLPDPNGWDINVTADTMWDDWQCSSTGTVDDVHFWVSWRGDQSSPMLWIDVSIWSDMPANDPNNPLPYSHPGGELWKNRFYPGEWREGPPQGGLQGWFDPQPPDQQTIIPNDHQIYSQINIEDIQGPFVQHEGEIYWLGIHIGPQDANTAIGWKTTQDHWNDDAVYWWTIPGMPFSWRELVDPTGASLDLAFVITGQPVIIPEPSTCVLLSLGATGLFAFVWRRRRSR